MIWLAVLGVVVNGAAVLKLRQGGNSLNEQVLTWHMLEDVLGWVAVLVGSLVMYFYDLPWIDPALSLAIAAFVLYNVSKRLWAAGKMILKATPEGLYYREVLTALQSVEGVEDAHHLHLWSLDGEYTLGSVHLVLAAQNSLSDAGAIKAAVRKVAHDRFGVEHLTVEVETMEAKLAHGREGV